MTLFFKKLEWKSSTVSWLSFVLMGVIVAGVGLVGTGHVVNYLQERLTVHGIEHNREIASALSKKLETSFRNGAKDIVEVLSHAIEDYKAFGFRILVLDRERRMIIVDSEGVNPSPVPVKQSWLSNAMGVSGSNEVLREGSGALRAFDENQHPILMWLQEMKTSEPDRWALGIANDQKTLTDFMGDLHWHLDAVMLLTYVLIALLGFYVMRRVGRLYERRLGSQVQQRTHALKEAHEQVLMKTRLATIGQTASVLTHEMRNPLASIKLALSGLKGAEALREREQRRIELVLGEVDRLNELLSETLDYVRPVKRSKNPVDLAWLLTKVMDQQAPVVEKRGIRLTFTHRKEDTAIRLDEAQIHQVLLNLINNAAEASPRGGEITIVLRRSNSELILEVGNQGEPMSPEVQVKAFDPFFTTKPKGTGLGLGLVKRVVEEHGGTVSLISDAETGTRVTLTFPVETDG